jgi:hypothetical protein
LYYCISQNHQHSFKNGNIGKNNVQGILKVQLQNECEKSRLSSLAEIELMKMTFYQIAGDQPGTAIYINPNQIVKVVPNGQNCRIHLSDKTSYDVGQSANVVKGHIEKCLQ